jgi:hypothetical protein
MRVVIFGGRDIGDYGRVCRAIEASGWVITEVIEGEHWSGVDQLAIRWAKEHGVPYRGFEADWDRLGRAAGPIRNGAMANDVAQALPDAGALGVWDGKSHGSADMCRAARKRGIPLFEDRAGLYYRQGQREQARPLPFPCQLGCGRSYVTDKQRDQHYAAYHRCCLPLPLPLLGGTESA